MEKKGINQIKTTLIIAIITLGLLITTSYIFIKLNNSKNSEKNLECEDLSEKIGLRYSACYDNENQKIILIIKKDEDLVNLNRLYLSFIDGVFKDYRINEFPELKNTKEYNIKSLSNPLQLNASILIQNKETEKNCEFPFLINLQNCSSDQISKTQVPFYSEIYIKDSMTDIEGYETNKGEFRNDSEELGRIIDIIPYTKEIEQRYIKEICVSDWYCYSWENCINGIQKRRCEDRNRCGIPTDIPITNRLCYEECYEEWICEWSDCSNGYTTPECKDLNNCGTTYNKPQKMRCTSYKYNENCKPDFYCTDWSYCSGNYDLDNLILDEVLVKGIQSRECIDKNNCLNTKKETRECSSKIDIYTKKKEIQNKTYLIIYDLITNKSLIQLYSKETERIREIKLLSDELNYPETCFNNKKDINEQSIDCGGVCKACEVPIKVEIQKDIFSRFIGRLYSIKTRIMELF